MNDASTPSNSGSPPPPGRRSLRRWLAGVAGLLAVALVAAGVAGRVGLGRRATTPNSDPFPVLPLSPSLFLNTGPNAQFIGSDACRSCHAERDASFRATGMGRSMAPADPEREP